ncbi:peptidase M23-like protein [Mumia flava]|uniref:Peptidase M23-like protein n=1 Tax=Mumia flava TaxID=1348852 RepID=A0A0B2BVS8_9ACTN|nr:peptidoglycan DD-metalloendopeptidase family protein [Mumia flava]PJJ58577.1 peptidase M23-like protein [Mumia flava]
MAVELATAYVSLVPSTRGMGAGIVKSLKGSERTLEKSGSNLGGRVKAGFGKALKAGALGASIVGALTVKKGLDRALGIEEAQAKLRGLGHDAESIQTIMESALKSVQGTAFGLDAAATTAAGAVAAGIKPGQELTKYLTAAADAATIAGVDVAEMGSIFNKVESNTVAYTDDLQQLADRGIPIFQWLRDEFDVSAKGLRKMVEGGEVDSDTFRKVITDNIGGAAQESGKTTTGAWKNLLASLGRVGANLLSGLLPDIRGGFGSITEALGPVEAKAKDFGAALGAGIDFVVPKIQALTRFVRENADVITIVGGAILGAAAAIKTITTVTKLWAAAQALLNAQWLANPIGIIIVAVAALAAAFVVAYRRSKTFRTIVDKAWAGIKKAISIAWKIISPILKAYWAYLTKVLIPVIVFLWKNVVKPVFAFIWKAIKKAWEYIKPRLEAWWKFTTDVLIPAIRQLWRDVIKPVFGSIWKAIKSAWTDRIKPVFEAVRDFVKDTLPTVFKRGIDAVKRQWDRLKNTAKAPVRFVIDTIWNNGLRKLIGAIPGVDTPDRVNVGFRRGGYTGNGHPSQVAGVVHGREWVIPADATRRLMRDRGPGFLRALNGYRNGGYVWPATGGVTRHSGYPWATWAGDINEPGAGDYGNPVRAYMDGVVASTAKLGTSYGWHVRMNHPGNGSTLYAHLSDILVSAGQRLSAGDLLGRVGSTGNSSGPHLHFEILGGRAPEVSSSSGGNSSWLSVIGNVKDFLSDVPDWLSTVKGYGGTWGTVLNSAVRSVGSDLIQWVNDKIPNRFLPDNPIPDLFDNGGMLTGFGVNRTGRPEPVLTDRQWDAVERHLPLGAGMSDARVMRLFREALREGSYEGTRDGLVDASRGARRQGR